jgi:uncharacterized protein
MMNKKKNHKKIKSSSNGNPSNYIGLIVVSLILILGTFYFFTRGDMEKEVEIYEREEPQFRKDGELLFLSETKGDTITKIDIEIAHDEVQRNQGLMYRRKMDYKRGMMFIFEDERQRSFWMKNTHIPLDILYIDQDLKIIKIQYNTTPFSERPIPSNRPAQYVLEVNAGFCERFGIKEGQFIVYSYSLPL